MKRFSRRRVIWIVYAQFTTHTWIENVKVQRSMSIIDAFKWLLAFVAFLKWLLVLYVYIELFILPLATAELLKLFHVLFFVCLVRSLFRSSNVQIILIIVSEKLIIANDKNVLENIHTWKVNAKKKQIKGAHDCRCSCKLKFNNKMLRTFKSMVANPRSHMTV